MKALLSLLLRTLLVLALVEGACSLLLLTLAAPDQVGAPLAERRHTRYDAELGWANVPGTRIEDMYGPGVSLAINAQGFRARREFSERVPDGRVRVVCLGDSFTLGFGVSDEDTWCARLASRDPRLETVNMGQGGYGADQSYLWYARDGVRLDHQLVVFAFLAEDFRRMRDDSFYGYGKPVLRLEDGRLVADNVPVPRRGFLAPWLTQSLALAQQLRTLELLRALRGAPGESAIEPTWLSRMAGALFRELARTAAARGARALLVYLPTEREFGSAYLDRWRELLAAEAARQQLPFVDLLVRLRQLPAAQVAGLYIREDALGYPHAAGHYSAEGNAWVARELYPRLRAVLDGAPAALDARVR